MKKQNMTGANNDEKKEKKKKSLPRNYLQKNTSRFRPFYWGILSESTRKR